MQPIRVALCITELEPGGAERCLTEVALGLDRNRFSTQVYVLGPEPAAGADELLRRLRGAGVPVQCFGANHWTKISLAARSLRRVLRRDRPQILQTFLFHANVLGSAVGRWCGVPAIVTNLRVGERRFLNRLRIEGASQRWATRIVAVSGSVAEQMRHFAGSAAERYVVIPNGVDHTRFQNVAPLGPHEWPLSEGRRRVAFVGRLDPQKGVDVLLRAAAGSAVAHPDWDYVLVGNGPERERLESQSRELSIDRRVYFLGRRDDVPRVLASCDLLAAPSRWEGMSNVLLEGMSAGLPVVASKVEGVGEALGPLAAEQAVSAGDEPAFAAQLRRLMGEESLRTQLGAANRERAVAEFSLAKMIERYDTLYESLASSSS